MSKRPTHEKMPVLFDVTDASADAGHASVITRIAPVESSRSTSSKKASNHLSNSKNAKSDPVRFFNVYAGRKRLATLKGRDIKRLGLAPGQTLDTETLEAIATALLRDKVETFAWKQINRRMYSMKQLRDRLIKRFPDAANEMIDSVLADLKRTGAVDDVAFAQALVTELNRTRPAGAKLVVDRLHKAGITDDTVIQSALAALKTTSSMMNEGGGDQLSDYLQRRYRLFRNLNSHKAAACLYRAGIQRGFDPDEVRQKVEHIVGIAFDQDENGGF